MAPECSKELNNHDLTNIAIPASSDPYDSGTPSPLSDVTPLDRLSPIEELEDEIHTAKAQSRNSYFDTSTQAQKPNGLHSRPRSRDFELDATIEKDGGASLEKHAELLFSRQHLELIFADKELSSKFGSFLRTYRPDSVPILAYYLDTIKALKTLSYVDTLVKNLEHIPAYAFTKEANGVTMKWVLEDKADRALDVLAENDLPAFIAYVYVRIVDTALVERVTGKAEPDSKDVADGLAEVFCLSDPSRPDNPLVFASDEFHRMTQYPSSLALGKNCRFLGGPKTDRNSISRFKASLDAEREHCEVMLNYRRDGTPFINLIMVVPLRDQNGRVRYYLGAQLDITDLVRKYTGLASLAKLLEQQQKDPKSTGSGLDAQIAQLDEFQQLYNTFTPQELESLALFQQQRDSQSRDGDGIGATPTKEHRVRMRNSTANLDASIQLNGQGSAPPLGFYQNYLLVRPYPSLRILFASPDLRIPGILQSPLLDQISGSPRVCDDLAQALEAGQKVTAKVRWLPRTSSNGRSRWIHCTPLISANGLIGVWMVILVDDDEEDHPDSAPSSVSARTTMDGAEFNNIHQPTPWEGTKNNRLSDDINDSPLTSNSSQTAFSDSLKPMPERMAPANRAAPELVSLPFHTSGKRVSKSETTSHDSKPGVWPVSATGSEREESGEKVEDVPRPRQGKPRFGQPPDFNFAIRPGPRINGRAYSIDSNGDGGSLIGENREEIGGRDHSRPTSRGDEGLAFGSDIRPPYLKWRQVSVSEEDAGVPGHGGRAPIKMPGRSSSDAQQPPVWKTKKSLSPYGVLFEG